MGQLVHETLRIYLSRRIASGKRSFVGKEFNKEAMDCCRDAIGSLNLNHSIGAEEVRPFLANFASLNKDNSLARIVYLERDLTGRLEGYTVKCIPDRVESTEANRIKIVDYKTGARQYVKDVQLEIYGFVLSQFDRRALELEYQFLKTGEIRAWGYSDTSTRRAINWMLDGIEEIESSRSFPRRRSGFCHHCGVSDYCQA